MTESSNSRRSSRRETLKVSGAVGVALAAGSLISHQASAQDATPAAGGLSRSVQTITLDAAARLVEAAEAKSTEIGVPMAIAIVDHGGLLKAFHRMDGLDRAVTVDLVQRKAYTSASFRAPTHVLAENAAENGPFTASLANIPGFTLIGRGDRGHWRRWRHPGPGHRGGSGGARRPRRVTRDLEAMVTLPVTRRERS
jgi:uncharacterized protein GlcG (DUF336 family)